MKFGIRAQRMTVMAPREAMTWCFVRALWYEMRGDHTMAFALYGDAFDKLPDARRQLQLELDGELRLP